MDQKDIAENRELLMLMEKCGHFLYHRRGGKRGQGRILRILMEEGETTQKQLQERLGIQPGSMSEIVAKLEGNGLICRMKDETDRRKVKLKITPEGKAFFQAKVKARMEEDSRLFEGMTKEEQRQLSVLLAKLFSNWETQFDKSLFEHGKDCRFKR